MGDLGTNIFLTLDEIKDELLRQIDAAGLERPCLVTVMPGQEVALDYCDHCDNGMAWTRLVSVTRLENQQAAVEQLANCGSGYTAVIEVGWMRGGPTVGLDDTGSVVEVPSEEELRHAAIHQFADMTMMQRALCRVTLSTRWKPKPVEYSPFGPQGGCYGGIWTVTIPVE